MTDNNTLRRLNWLWKHRHKHDGEDFQHQITIIQTQVENQGGEQAQAGVGAHIFLSASAQSLDGLEAIEWDLSSNVLEFSPSLPSTDLVINKPGYYWVRVELAWDTFTGGGLVNLVRVRDGASAVVYPDGDPGEWLSTSGRRFVDSAGGLQFNGGDILQVQLLHEEVSSVDLDYAFVQVALMDRLPVEAPPPPVAAELVDETLTERQDLTSDSLLVTMTTAQESGDAMFMFMVSIEAEITMPAGWTVLVDNANYGEGSTFYYWSLVWKVSDGTETNLTVTSAANDRIIVGVWVVRSAVDYTMNSPTVVAGTGGTSNFAFPAVSPSAGNYLVFGLFARNGGNQTPSNDPPGYTFSPVLRKDSGSSGQDFVGLEVWYAIVTISTSEQPGQVDWPFWFGARLGGGTLAVPI